MVNYQFYTAKDNRMFLEWKVYSFNDYDSDIELFQI